MNNAIEADIKGKNFIETIDKAKKDLDEGKKPINEIKKAVEKLFQNKKEKRTQLDLIERQTTRTYKDFEREHRKKIAKGGFITGYDNIDKNIFFSIGDFNVIQSMSNHGKTSFQLTLCYKFLRVPNNQDKKPICVFITYESSSLRIEEKFHNIVSSHLENDLVIKCDRTLSGELPRQKGCYLYPSTTQFTKSLLFCNELRREGSLFIMERTPLERLEALIMALREKYPSRPIILFLDYIQIIKNDLKGDGWEKIKHLAYWLEEFAIKHEIVLFTGSQVNEKRETREGKDIYNAATNVIDLFNCSHAKIKNHTDLKSKYKEKVDNKSVISITGDKAKNFSSFYIGECLLFNGFKFEEVPQKTVIT